MTRSRCTLDIDRLDEERVELRVCLSMLGDAYANHQEIEMIRQRITTLDRQIHELRINGKRS